MFRRGARSWSSRARGTLGVSKALWATYTALLAWGLTLAPLKVVGAVESATSPLVPFPDPGASARHFLLFLGEGFLSCLALGWEGLAFAVSFGGGTELLQYFIPWRTYDVHDLTANVLGSLAGFYLAMRARPLLGRLLRT